MADIKETVKRPGNDQCADCQDSNPQFACGKYAVFICSKCASVYRDNNIGVVKSVSLDKWSAEELQNLRAGGNIKIAKLYESQLPPFYRRPTADANCPDLIRRQFILAKYTRLEFQDADTQEGYHQVGGGGFYRRGRLLKRLRDSDKYVERLFELSERDNYLRYYVKDINSIDGVSKSNSNEQLSGASSGGGSQGDLCTSGSHKPKTSIPLDKLNATFLTGIGPEKQVVLHLLFPSKEGIRSLYLLGLSDPERTIVEWYNAIRGCKYHRALMSLQEPDCSQLTYDFKMVGWLEKTGPLEREAWKRRWCCFGKRTLLYFSDYLDPFGKGEVWLGESNDGEWNAHEGAPAGFKKKSKGFLFTLVTPDRRYIFSAETKQEQDKWLSAFREVLSTPATPQDRADAAAIAVSGKKFGRR